ncbi:MAG: DUF465 domain-containing protein [Acidobacteriota bacterium]
MEIPALDTVKQELIKENQAFRELVQQHHNYEERLTQLAELTYPNDEELLEETTLKKKKLIIKDQMYAMLQDYSSHQV